MIVLNPESWFVKYWIRWGCTEGGYGRMLKLPPYNSEDFCSRMEIQTGTNLCQIGRVVIYAIIKTLFVGAVATFLVSNMIFHPFAFFSVIAFIIIAAGLIFAIAFSVKYTIEKVKGLPVQENLAWQWVKAKKGKYCPRVEFTTPSNSTPSNTSGFSS
jgi:hypothetical protein